MADPTEDRFVRPTLPVVPSGRAARSAFLKETAGILTVALHCTRRMGADARALDAPFPCLLHHDCLASLTRDRKGEIVYKDGHQADGRRRFQTLAEVRAALAYGASRRLKPLELSLWRTRLLHESGLLVLPEVLVPELLNCPPFVLKVRDGFELLIRCREWLDPGSPVAFARQFTAAWCGSDPASTQAALAFLVGQSVIVKVGEAPSGRLRPANLYRPGPVG